jgi:hypothetical protein
LKIGIVAPRWGSESTADEAYMATLARSLATKHDVQVLAEPIASVPDSPALAEMPASAGDDFVVGPALRRTDPESGPLPRVRPAQPAVAASAAARRQPRVMHLPAHALDRLPRWLAASSVGRATARLVRPLLHWSMMPSVEELVGWADVLLVPAGGEDDLIANAVARLATAQEKPVVALPSEGDPHASLALIARVARAIVAPTRARARALTRAGWPSDRLWLTGLLPELTTQGDAGTVRRRYRIPGPFVLSCAMPGSPGHELLRAAIGLVWHKRPETTFVFLSRERSARRTTRTSHAGHVLYLSGLDEAERSSALAAATVVCAPDALPRTGAPVADAWALGRPVVTIESAAARELVGDGQAGIVAAPDAHDLASALLRVLSDPGLADRLGLEGQRRMREVHGRETLLAALERRAARWAQPVPMPVSLPAAAWLAEPRAAEAAAR